MSIEAMGTNGEIKGPLELVRELQRIVRQLPTVKMGPPHFREGTELPVTIHSYYLSGGGIGDRICTLPVFVYLAKHAPYIWGRVWVDRMLLEIFQNILAQTGHPEWKALPIDEFVECGNRITGRGFQPSDGTKIQYTGGTGGGGHLVDAAWIEHANKFPPPIGGAIMPEIDFSGWSDPSDWTWRHQGLGGKKSFVVFTTGAVSPSREVPGHYWNAIIEDVKSRGLTPVFLGSSVMKNKLGDVRVNFSDGCNYGEGIDLRNKTTLMEAAWIMKNAAAVIGLDNGLIQLASLTDANIICAYNIVHPSERVPRRERGRFRALWIEKDELSCSGCQTFQLQTAPPHDFKRCLHQDLKCIDMLFQNEGQRFREALDLLLG